MVKQIFCFRVWMKDGYAGLFNAEDADKAKELAIAAATKSIEGAAMSPADRRKALTVDYFENLTENGRG